MSTKQAHLQASSPTTNPPNKTAMAKTTLDTWNPHCLRGALFEPLTPLAAHIRSFEQQWPSLDDYQRIADRYRAPIQSQNNKTIRFVPQGTSPNKFEQHYEPRIYLKGEVQTRLENWHDFFQVLVWSVFPKTKVALNARHYHAALERHNTPDAEQNRSPIENLITLFDECGAIIVSSNPQLLALIREHAWQQLFWQQRDQVTTQLKCIIFGHALYEKALSPYIGMTAHCLMLTVEETTLALPCEKLTAYCDEHIAQQFCPTDNRLNSPKDLSPFPLLGMPGWHPDNKNQGFYDNQRYFRPKRS